MNLSTKPWKTGFAGFPAAVCLLVIFLMTLCLSVSAQCAVTKQKTFGSPEEAVRALVDSLKNKDTAALGSIFGRSSEQLVSSGDPVADRHNRQTFVSAYEEMHRFDLAGKSRAVLVIGKAEWPFPIPLVRKNNRWRFDTEAGRQEILNRRIGRNELETIQTCLAIVDAQREYAMHDSDGNGIPDYAARFFSDPGKKNGLYWQTKEGEEPSPLGELVANATAKGYAHGKSGGNPAPYQGYYYRMLKRQGEHAQGGAFDYMVRGKMIGGFAVLAWPASYGSSGVMSFVVNHDGVVYQKDLGRDTAVVAKKLEIFDPGPGWKKAEPTVTK